MKTYNIIRFNTVEYVVKVYKNITIIRVSSTDKIIVIESTAHLALQCTKTAKGEYETNAMLIRDESKEFACFYSIEDSIYRVTDKRDINELWGIRWAWMVNKPFVKMPVERIVQYIPLCEKKALSDGYSIYSPAWEPQSKYKVYYKLGQPIRIYEWTKNSEDIINDEDFDLEGIIDNLVLTIDVYHKVFLALNESHTCAILVEESPCNYILVSSSITRLKTTEPILSIDGDDKDKPAIWLIGTQYTYMLNRDFFGYDAILNSNLKQHEYKALYYENDIDSRIIENSDLIDVSEIHYCNYCR